MPDGVVQWFDSSTGEVSVLRGGRSHRARAADVEPAARRPGARVHFDVRRDGGELTAVDVRLRRGTRVSHRQGRFGTLVGSRTGQKGATSYGRMHPGLVGAVAVRPLEVARAWAANLAEGDLDGALSLYSPDAVLHTAKGTVTGRAGLRASLETSPVLGSGRQPQIRGLEGTEATALAVFEPTGTGVPATTARFRLDHGLIAEEWLDEPSPARESTVVAGRRGPIEVTLSAAGEVTAEDKAYAVERIGRLIEQVGDPVLFASIKLERKVDPARARPAVAEAALDVDGELVRAHLSAHTLAEATDLLQRRLRGKLTRRAEQEHEHRAGTAEPGEWRHGDLPTQRPEYFDRPVEQRQLVRHKALATDELTVDEAVFDMDQLDYDFYLFRDLASGVDSVVERLGDGTYRLSRLAPSQGDLGPSAVPGDAGPAAVPVQLNTVPAPELTLDAAIERLNAGGEPFVFFAQAGSDSEAGSEAGTGEVLYRRYDGHYGLIVAR